MGPKRGEGRCNMLSIVENTIVDGLKINKSKTNGCILKPN